MGSSYYSNSGAGKIGSYISNFLSNNSDKFVIGDSIYTLNSSSYSDNTFTIVFTSTSTVETVEIPVYKSLDLFNYNITYPNHYKKIYKDNDTKLSELDDELNYRLNTYANILKNKDVDDDSGCFISWMTLRRYCNNISRHTS